jgi:hypothetical protein
LGESTGASAIGFVTDLVRAGSLQHVKELDVWNCFDKRTRPVQEAEGRRGAGGSGRGSKRGTFGYSLTRKIAQNRDTKAADAKPENLCTVVLKVRPWKSAHAGVLRC